MDKLIYIPKYHQFSVEKLKLIRFYANRKNLLLEIHIAIINPYQMDLLNMNQIEKHTNTIKNEWQKNIDQLSFCQDEIQISFHVVDIYFDFLQSLLTQECVGEVFAESASPLFCYLGKHRDKLITLRTIKKEALKKHLNSLSKQRHVLA